MQYRVVEQYTFLSSKESRINPITVWLENKELVEDMCDACIECASLYEIGATYLVEERDPKSTFSSGGYR